MIHKKIISTFICILIVLGNIVLPQTTVMAANDYRAPDFVSASVDKTSAVVGDSVEITVMTVDLGEINHVDVYYQSPITKRTIYVPLSKVNWQTCDSTITFSSTSEIGLWKILEIHMFDDYGNNSRIYNSTFYPNASNKRDLSNCNIELKGISPTSISLNKSIMNLLVGETDSLIATVEPSNVTNKDVIWSSSDNSVATVDPAGNVIAVGAGTSVITATTVDGRKTSTCKVEVANPVVAYTLTYKGNGNTGGTEPIDSETYLDNDIVTVLGNTGSLIKTGYTYSGWNTKADGSGTSYVVGDIFNMGPADIILYAKWIANKYTVNFDSQGGSPVASMTADYDSTITAPTAPIKVGYTFVGWVNYENPYLHFWDFKSDILRGDTTLTAVWIANKYTVIFDSQGGSEEAMQTIGYNTTITEPTAPTKKENTFSGWYKEAECINAWDFAADEVTEDTTLYAMWTINAYTVTFNSKGGNYIPSKTADYNSIIIEPTAPTKIGYTFGGWYKEFECLNAWYFSLDTVTADTILYAKWIDICDLDRDGEVNILDLASTAQNYNIKNTDEKWNSNFDFNKDGIINIFDLVICSKRIKQ